MQMTMMLLCVEVNGCEWVYESDWQAEIEIQRDRYRQRDRQLGSQIDKIERQIVCVRVYIYIYICVCVCQVGLRKQSPVLKHFLNGIGWTLNDLKSREMMKMDEAKESCRKNKECA